MSAEPTGVPPPLPALPPPGRPKFTAAAVSGPASSPPPSYAAASPQLGGRPAAPFGRHQSSFSPRGGGPLLQKAESMTLEAVRGSSDRSNFFHGDYPTLSVKLEFADQMVMMMILQYALGFKFTLSKFNSAFTTA